MCLRLPNNAQRPCLADQAAHTGRAGSSPQPFFFRLFRLAAVGQVLAAMAPDPRDTLCDMTEPNLGVIAAAQVA